jgi:nucleotide-sensitive chloride channel 1A
VSDSQAAGPEGNRQQYIFLQVRPENEEEIMNEEDIDYLDLKLIPLTLFNETTHSGQANGHGVNGTNGSIALDPVTAIFKAISACSDLHPDPDMSDDGGEPELGTGGWITAENMNDFIDEDGNFIGGHAMGPGAGTVRTREEREEGTRDEDPIHRSDSEQGDDPTKRRRTD